MPSPHILIETQNFLQAKKCVPKIINLFFLLHIINVKVKEVVFGHFSRIFFHVFFRIKSLKARCVAGKRVISHNMEQNAVTL